jgi:secreted PhoX family phosphatase
LFILNLDDGTYKKTSTEHGLLKGQPDQIQRIVPNSDILYFTEDGNAPAGIHGRNAKGQFFTILEGPGHPDETTGLAFSPDKKHMYVAFQDNGVLFDITRIDGLTFDGQVLNMKYH